MDMIKMIGKAARNGFLVAFFNALQQEDEVLNQKVEDLIGYAIPIMFNEFTVPVWENWLNLKSIKNWNLEDRIQRIIYTLNSNVSCTKEFLKEQARLFDNGEIDIVENFQRYSFTIDFLSENSLAINTENFDEMVKLNKPAHLLYTSKFRYRMPTIFNNKSSIVYKINRTITNELSATKRLQNLKTKDSMIYRMQKEMG